VKEKLQKIVDDEQEDRKPHYIYCRKYYKQNVGADECDGGKLCSNCVKRVKGSTKRALALNKWKPSAKHGANSRICQYAKPGGILVEIKLTDRDTVRTATMMNTRGYRERKRAGKSQQLENEEEEQNEVLVDEEEEEEEVDEFEEEEIMRHDVESEGIG
jgi:hypothetical protein